MATVNDTGLVTGRAVGTATITATSEGKSGTATVSVSQPSVPVASSETYVPPLSLSRGVWHKIEYWVKLNTPGQYNATEKFWIDGVLRGVWSGFRYRTTSDLRPNSFLISASAATTATTRKTYIDDILILTATPSP